MKTLRLCLLIPLLVPMGAVQAREQADTLLVNETVTEKNSIFSNIFEEEEDNTLQTRVKGFLDTYHALRTSGGHWMASRTRARGELMLEKGASSFFVSLNATHNGILKERTGIELREAYLSYAKSNWDMRVGRQIVVWGVADALRLTDCISPFDYTEFLAQDYDDIRMPVNALRAKYALKALTFEAVCTPVADFFVLPTDARNPWAMRLPVTPSDYTFDLESRKPEKRLKNIEYGGRITANLRGADFSVSALRTWNKIPALALSLSPDGRRLSGTGIYRRMTMLGADCSLPIGQFVLRAETAAYLRETQSANWGSEVARRDVVHTLLGMDWYPGNDWNISAQYSHKYVSGNLVMLNIYRNTGLATARITKDLLRSTLKLSTFAYIDVADGDIFNRFSATYNLNDQIELTAGYDYFHSQRGMFAMYSQNSEIWVKMKYSF